jgi:hypothetical protein
MPITVVSSDSATKSQSLMEIVAVVYGVAVTLALTLHSQVLLHPSKSVNRLPALVLLAALILTCYAFFSYVLVIGGGAHVYRVGWTANKGWHEQLSDPVRFAADLVLAGLYVRLLLAATEVPVGPKTSPSFRDLFLSTGFVMLGVLGVRLLRYGFANLWPKLLNRYLPPILFAAVAFAFAALARGHDTHAWDDGFAWGLLLGAILYTVVNHALSFFYWRDHDGRQDVLSDVELSIPLADISDQSDDESAVGLVRSSLTALLNSLPQSDASVQSVRDSLTTLLASIPVAAETDDLKSIRTSVSDLLESLPH